MIRYICMVLLKYKPHDKLLILNCLHCDPWQFLGTTRGFKVWCMFICLSVQYAIWLWYHPVTKRRGIIFNIRISENIFIQNLFYNIVRILWLHKSLFYHGYYRLGERCCPFASCLTHDIFLIPLLIFFVGKGDLWLQTSFWHMINIWSLLHLWSIIYTCFTDMASSKIWKSKETSVMTNVCF